MKQWGPRRWLAASKRGEQYRCAIFSYLFFFFWNPDNSTQGCERRLKFVSRIKTRTTRWQNRYRGQERAREISAIAPKIDTLISESVSIQPPTRSTPFFALNPHLPHAP